MQKPDWWPKNPYPVSIFPMPEEQYLEIVPDPELRTALSGMLGRRFWDTASDAMWAAALGVFGIEEEPLEGGGHIDADFEVLEGERGRYWHGHAEGDKSPTELDAGEPLILDPNHFTVGYMVKGLEPGRCIRCGQVDEGQTGEHPCSACGLPQLWDGKPGRPGGIA